MSSESRVTLYSLLAGLSCSLIPQNLLNLRSLTLTAADFGITAPYGVQK
jgi:hypothetical protein